MKLTEYIDAEITRREEADGEYDLKEIAEAARLAFERGELDEDPVDRAIKAAVKARDKISVREPDEQLTLDGYGAWPRSLVLGDNERQPSHSGKLEHVLADQAIKQTNFVRQTQAMQRLMDRNVAILSYLQRGMTLAEAVKAANRDNGSGA